MNRPLAATLLAATAALTLAGCGNTAAKDNTPSNQIGPLTPYTVQLADGRTIECVSIVQGDGHSKVGGPTCWPKGR